MLLQALQKLIVPSHIPASARSPEGARAGLFYRAGEWDKAHHVAQDLNTLEGSFWHGILHRQEGDSSNAAYWFRRVGQHPIYPAIYADAAEILNGSPWQLSSQWDPIELNHWCEQATSDPSKQVLATRLQVSEWQHLFNWCSSPDQSQHRSSDS